MMRHLLLTTALLLASVSCNKLKPGGSDGDQPGKDPSKPASTGATLPATANDVPFAGTYSKYAVTTFKNGQRVQVSNNSGTATITIGNGKAIWVQEYMGQGGKMKKVTQTYGYTQADVRPATAGFDVKLLFEKMEGDTSDYSPDKNNPRLQARKQAGGWQIGLTTTDNNGIMGGVEFK